MCRNRILADGLLLAAATLSALLTAAQSPPACTLDVPVSVALRNGNLVPGLPASSFTAASTRGPLSIEAAVYDTGPRRIVIVVDRGSGMKSAAATITREAIDKILSGARPQDSFALITTGAGARRISFGRSASDLSAEVSNVFADAKPKGSWLDLLDGMAEAAGWFSTAQRGDAMLVFTSEDEFREGRVGFRKAYDTLTTRGIRVFAMLFGPIIAGGYMSVIDWGAPPGAPRDLSFGWAQREDLNHLVRETGGFLLAENMAEPWREYKLDEKRLQALVQIGWQMYGSIAELYVVKVKMARKESGMWRWTLSLTPDQQKKLPHADLAYPGELQPCVSSSENRSQ